MDKRLDEILIQNWPDRSLKELLRFLQSVSKYPYTDIRVYGSRVIGGFKPKSDIDIGIYTKQIAGREGPYNYQWHGFKIQINYMSADKKFLAFGRFETSSYSLTAGILYRGKDDKKYRLWRKKLSYENNRRNIRRNTP